MARKQVMISVVVFLLALAVFNILPISGQIICPWCDNDMQTKLLDCVHVEMVNCPELNAMSPQEVDDITGEISSESDSMVGLSYVDKKVKMDEIFMEVMADAIKRNNYEHNQEIINLISDLAGKCYSSVTGYDPRVVTRDIKKMIKKNIKKITTPFGENSTPAPSSEMPYPSTQTQRNDFQLTQPQTQSTFIPANPDTTIMSSPKISSTPQISKSSNADSYMTTLSPISDVPDKKATETDKPKAEEPCDEKFKNALYAKLKNDDRFRSFFGKVPVSTADPAVSRIMNRVFKEYGIEQHYEEFSTFWKFDSKTLKRESKAEDWGEVISKICKIIFTRNNLLTKDCEEIGSKIADYVLDELAGDSAFSNAEKPNQNGENDKATAESSAVSSGQKIALHQVLQQLHQQKIIPILTILQIQKTFRFQNSILNQQIFSSMMGQPDSGKVPLSELLSSFETQLHLMTLHKSAESCKSPSGFDFDIFLRTMMQKNHPDWSQDKCEKEVLTKKLQDSLSSDDKADQSSSNHPDTSGDSNDSQNSNSDAQSFGPNGYDHNMSSYDYPGTATDYNSDISPQQQQDLTNYGKSPDRLRSVNILPSGNQPHSGNWNAGLKQPQSFAPGPVNTNNGDFTK